MNVSLGYRLETRINDIAVVFYGGTPVADVFEVTGFTSRLEAWMFIATYVVLMFSSRESDATKLLREFTSRVKPS